MKKSFDRVSISHRLSWETPCVSKIKSRFNQMNLQTTSLLPAFRYHPDPLVSGSVVESAGEVQMLQAGTEFIYTGPVYAEKDLDEALCPWCIANGVAAENLKRLSWTQRRSPLTHLKLP